VLALILAVVALTSVAVAIRKATTRRYVVRWNPYQLPLYRRMITARTLESARDFAKLNKGNNQ
jgi:hypothetical protein